VSNPWEDVPGLWKDEMAFLNWLRSQTRKTWSRHPVKNEYCRQRPTISRLFAVESGVIDPKQFVRAKKLRQCEMCEGWFPVSALQVDHLDGGYGFKNMDEFFEWYKRMLLIGFDDIRELCIPCHEKVTLSQKLGCSMEDIPYHQDRIAFGKLKAAQQHKVLADLELSSGNNADARMEIYLEHLGDKYDKS